MRDYKIFSRKLKEELYECNMTQRELAGKTGITEASISRYMTGKRIPRPRELVLISEALDVNPGYLLGADEPQPARKTYESPEEKWKRKEEKFVAVSELVDGFNIFLEELPEEDKERVTRPLSAAVGRYMCAISRLYGNN